MKIYSSIHLAFCVQKSLLFLLDISELIRAQAHSENNFYDFNIIHCDFSWPKSLESTPNKSKSVAFRSTHAQRQKLFFFFFLHVIVPATTSWSYTVHLQMNFTLCISTIYTLKGTGTNWHFIPQWE